VGPTDVLVDHGLILSSLNLVEQLPEELNGTVEAVGCPVYLSFEEAEAE
jgi:hypothetical protein